MNELKIKPLIDTGYEKLYQLLISDEVLYCLKHGTTTINKYNFSYATSNTISNNGKLTHNHYELYELILKLRRLQYE